MVAYEDNANYSPVSTHSHPKVAAATKSASPHAGAVSTHSHPKVAATAACPMPRSEKCFNTQPPEGGCRLALGGSQLFALVSTHSHPKVAAKAVQLMVRANVVSTHSHPKVAA